MDVALIVAESEKEVFSQVGFIRLGFLRDIN